MLRIVSKASSVESFIQLFRRFCDRESVFIATRTPKQTGTRTRFTVTLSTGEPMLTGYGEVTGSYSGDNDSPHGRPGMQLHFIELDEHSRVVVDQLVQDQTPSGRKPPLPGLPSPPPEGQDPMLSAPQALGTMPTVPHAMEAGPRPPTQEEIRTAGSEFILPANPFGELTNESLEAFVECTMYEEAGPGTDEPRDTEPSLEPGSSRAVTWWPPTGQASMLPVPTPQGEQPGSMPATFSSAPPARPRTSLTPVSHRTQLKDHVRGSKPMHTAVIVQPRRISAGRIIAITVLLSAFVGLGAGYLLWGSGESATTTADASAGAPLQAAADAATPVPAADAAPAGSDAGEDAPAKGGVLAGTTGDDDCTVQISSKPDETEVYAGERLLGETPLDTSLPCGTAELLFKRPRYEDETKTVTLTPGEPTRVRVRLHRPRIPLEVTSTPPGATVIVNRKRVGKTPLSIEIRGYRRTTVLVRESGYRRFRKRIYPKPPGERIHAKLRRR